MTRKKKFKIENHVSGYTIRELELNNIPLDDDYGDNLKFTHTDNGNEIISYVRRDKDGYREVYLEITSLRGSIGAVHFYATLRDTSIHFTSPEDKKKTSSIGGYGTKGVPEKYENLRIELERPVDELDIKHDNLWGREEYEMSRIGDLTRGFWNEEDGIKVGIDAFKAIFKGKWKLTINSYSGKKVKPIYRDKI